MPAREGAAAEGCHEGERERTPDCEGQEGRATAAGGVLEAGRGDVQNCPDEHG